MKVKYILLLLFLSIAFLLLPGIREQKRAICEDCNVIIVDISTLRADHLGCYGYARDTSPNLDMLAKDSVLFKSSFSHSPYTTAEHMSILTSMYPHSHGMKIPNIYAPSPSPGIRTLAEILKDEGYTTVATVPVEYYKKSNIMNESSKFSEGIDFFISSSKDYENGTVYWEDNLKWIRENGSSSKFYMFLQSYKVHDPYTPSDKTVLRFTDELDGRIVSSDLEMRKVREIMYNKILSDPGMVFQDSFIGEHRDLFSNKTLLNDSLPRICDRNVSAQFRTCASVINEAFWGNVNTSSESDINYLKVLYDGEIYEADEDVKRLIDTLRSENLLNKTILVITSDHGEEFMEHGDVLHSKKLFDESIRVPLIIHAPNVLGKEVPYLSEGVDIMPTILDLLGICDPPQTEGISLAPMMTGDPGPLKEYVYAENAGSFASIRSTNWKYITDFDEISGLYSLKDDPFEQDNLVETRPEIANLMRTKLEEHMSQNPLAYGVRNFMAILRCESRNLKWG